MNVFLLVFFCLIVFNLRQAWGTSIRNEQMINQIQSKRQQFIINYSTMKIALKHQTTVKIFNGCLNYQAILAFASQEFTIPAQSCCLTYSDDEGDEITISSTEDFNILQELYKDKPLIKINIKTSDSKELIEITDQPESPLKDSFEKLTELTKREEDLVHEQQITENTCDGNEKKEAQTHPDKTLKERHHGHHGRGHGRHGKPWHFGHHSHHGHHRGLRNSDSSSSHEQRHFHKFHKMQHFMNEKIAHQVDERIKVLLPCLQNQLNPQNQIKLFSVSSSLLHPSTECKGCYAAPITGIRYKCLTCPDFSLCQKCETTIQHPHNLLKMKFVEESQGKSMPFGCFKRQGKHFSRCHSSSSSNSKSHSKSKDPQFWAVKKAKKLAKIFGGQPEDYKEFISANKDLHLGETIGKFAKENNRDFSSFKGCKISKVIEKLTKFFDLSKEQAEKYVEQNSSLKGKQLIEKYSKDNSISEDELNQKRIAFKCQKLGKFFEKDPEQFRSIVSTNLDLRPYQLKKLILEQQYGQECQRPWGFRHGFPQEFACKGWKKQSSPFMKKQQKLSEQKKQKEEKKSGSKRAPHQEKKSKDKSQSFKKENIQKSNILKVMVQYFGTYNIDEYYKLIDEHLSEGQEKIIQLYIDNHAK